MAHSAARPTAAAPSPLYDGDIELPILQSRCYHAALSVIADDAYKFHFELQAGRLFCEARAGRR